MRKLLLFATAVPDSIAVAVEGSRKLVANSPLSMRVRELRIKLDRLIGSDER